MKKNIFMFGLVFAVLTAGCSKKNEPTNVQSNSVESKTYVVQKFHDGCEEKLTITGNKASYSMCSSDPQLIPGRNMNDFDVIKHDNNVISIIITEKNILPGGLQIYKQDIGKTERTYRLNKDGELSIYN